MEYRILTEENHKDYKSIRLELLSKHPTNFGSSFEEESLFDENRWIKRLNNPNATTIGAYDNDVIVGICVIMGNPRMKMKHKATLNSMYVKTEYRGKGVSKGLLEKGYSLLRERNVEILQLSVMSTNKPAIRLYEEEGFIYEGNESKAIKLEGEYFDLIFMQKNL